MSSHEFILQNAESDRTAVLLPGWATDWRIFGDIGRAFNRIVPKKLSPSSLADELYISSSTVRTHVKNIYSKLDVHRRYDAVQRGKDLGLI